MRLSSPTGHEALIPGITLTIVMACLVTDSQARVLISDEDIPQAEQFVTTSLSGYRSIPQEFLQMRTESSESIGYWVHVWRSSPDVIDVMQKQGKSVTHATPNDWYGAAKIASKSLSHHGEGTFVTVPVGYPEPRNVTVDRDLIVDLAKSEIFQGGRLAVNNDAAKNISWAYNKLEVSGAQNPTESIDGFKVAAGSVNNYKEVAKQVALTLGEITFGVPLVDNTLSENLIIPSSIADSYDVYWIQFAVTFREGIDYGSAEQLEYSVIAPEDVIALELVPLKFGIEEDHIQRAQTPDIKLGLGGAEVSIGTVYAQEVAFKSLRPTIIGFGLQENRFSWVIKDQAIGPGARRFIAILGVPKASNSVTVQMHASVKVKRRSFLQGDRAWTPPVHKKLSLR